MIIILACRGTRDDLYMMKTVLAVLMMVPSLAPPFVGTPSPLRSGVTAFVAVNVLPMDRDHVLLNQTVLIEDGKIKAIGPSVPLPPDARMIDDIRSVAPRFACRGLR